MQFLKGWSRTAAACAGMSLAASGFAQTTVFSEDFEDEPTGFTITFSPMNQVNVSGDFQWGVSNNTFFTATNRASLNAFSDSSAANEDWLITPALDFSSLTDAALAFDARKRFAGDEMDVRISTTYDPNTDTDPNTGGFTSLGITDLNLGDVGSSGAVVNVTGVDLSAAAGQSAVYIAFVYTGEGPNVGGSGLGADTAGSWELDNIAITSTGGGGGGPSVIPSVPAGAPVAGLLGLCALGAAVGGLGIYASKRR